MRSDLGGQDGRGERLPLDAWLVRADGAATGAASTLGGSERRGDRRGNGAASGAATSGANLSIFGHWDRVRFLTILNRDAVAWRNFLILLSHSLADLRGERRQRR